MTGPLLTPDFGLPEELKALIDESCKRFEDQWGAMKAIAKANGWFDNYRKEITGLVSTAYHKGETVVWEQHHGRIWETPE
jgi:hypothetical protein